MVADGVSRRAFQTVLEGMALAVSVVCKDEQTLTDFTQFELIVADEDIARNLRPMLDVFQSSGGSLRPALIAIGPKSPERDDETFDAFVAVPSMLSEITARLSVVLYSHRALARRYQSALEELNLNRNIFKSVTNGISVANAQLPDMPLMYVNPAFELMTGYSLEEIQGKNCRFLQGQDRDQPGLVLIREAIRQKRQTVAILKNYRKDGSCFWNELTLSPVLNHAGELTHFVGIQMDVSDRVRVEAALRESEKLAAVGRLASTISHEINNPLEAVTNLVYLAAALLPERPDTAETRHYLTGADEELRRVKDITSQSLRFARQSSDPLAVFLNSTIESVLDIYKARLRNYGIEIHTRLRSTQHVVVFESEIRQVISNLVNNAIDTMKTTDRRGLYIRTREATDFRSDRTGVLLTISDQGSGIAPRTREGIFKAFFSTKGQNGTGLGLWVTMGIIERHHGRILVRSSTDKDRCGTTFEIFLPFQAAISGPAEPAGE